MTLDTRQLSTLRSIREHVVSVLSYLNDAERLSTDPEYAGSFLFPPTERGLCRTGASLLHDAADRLGDLGRELP